MFDQDPSPEIMHYANAKVVLVGDSGVGKSGLALVLTGKPFVPTDSTHGRRVWLLDEEDVCAEEIAHTRHKGGVVVGPSR